MVGGRRRTLRAWALVLAGAAIAGGVGCGGTQRVTVGPPTTMSPLEVSVDPSGRPYDEWLRPGATLSTEPLTALTLPGGKAVITDGIQLGWLDGEYADQAGDLGDGARYPLDAVWLHDHAYKSVAGLVLVVSDQPVATWSAFESAYGTDGGLGVITSTEYLEVNADRSAEEQERASYDWLDRLGDKPLLTEDL